MRNRSRLHLSGKRRWVYLGATIGLAAFMLVVLTNCGWSLITDQEMIEHFNAHKQEFNALVQSYLDHGRDYMEWAKRPDVIELKAKTGIGRIQTGPHIWFDDPYSLEAAKKEKQMMNDKTFSQNHFRREAMIEMANQKIHSTFYLTIGGINWKDYHYFPIDPQIENGKIKLPSSLIGIGTPDLSWRVVESTDSMNHWNSKMGECIMKKIESKWYIRRCRAR